MRTTELEHALQSLEKHRMMLKTVLDNVPFAVLTMDPHRRVTHVHSGTQGILGPEPLRIQGAILDETCERIGIPRDLLERGFRMLEEEETVQLLEGVGDERQSRYVELRLFKLRNSAAGLRGYGLFYQDVTETKRTELQLQHAQKMEALGTLAGGIAHDFNNLLQAVSGYAQLLMMEKSSEDPDTRFLIQILNAATRGTELVRQLMMLGRKSQPRLRVLDLNQEVEQARDLLSRTVPRTIRLETRLEPFLEAIQGDPAQVMQVVMNLGKNAADAMPEGGLLLFETRNLDLTAETCKIYPRLTPGPYVVLQVSDTGHGMDAETMERIFEPFFTTKEPESGTGLGLSMVYGIVTSHRGHITCYSHPGKGTTFKAYFPVYRPERQGNAIETVEPESGPSGKETVLIVDDEASILEVSSKILRRYGYTPWTARSGEEALAVIEKHGARPDLVILDLSMPGMGGSRCLEELLERAPDLKILVSSGYSGELLGQETLKAGAVGFIPKPYHLPALLKAVRAALDKA